MKRKHTPTTPRAIGSETQSNKSNGNSEAKAEEEKQDHEFPQDDVLSEDSSEEAVIYDLWGTNNEEDTNAASNTSKKWSSEEKGEDRKNSDSELSWEDGSDDNIDSLDRCSDHPKNEMAESLRENVASVMERLNYMITKERDPAMKECMLKYKDILEGKLNVKMEFMNEGEHVRHAKEHRLGSAKGRGLGSAEGYGLGGAEGLGVSGAGHGVRGAEGHGVSGAERHGVSGAERHGVSGAEGHGVSGTEGHGPGSNEDDGLSSDEDDGLSSDEDDSLSSEKDDSQSSDEDDSLSSDEDDGLSGDEDDGLSGDEDDEVEDRVFSIVKRRRHWKDLWKLDFFRNYRSGKFVRYRTKIYDQNSTETGKVNHEEEEQQDPILQGEDGADEYFDLRGKLLSIQPLPREFFTVRNEFHPLNTARKLALIDDLIIKETDEDLKKRMKAQRKVVVDHLYTQLKSDGTFDQYKEKLTFNEGVSKRISTIMDTVKNLEDQEEVYLEDKEEEIHVLKELFEEGNSQLKEENSQLSEVIAETLADTEEEKKHNAAEVNTLESHKFVKALPSTILVPPEDLNDSDEEEEDEYKDDEYKDDTSDEEDIRNTVGNIPMRWYDDYDHLGYDWEGNKIVKPPAGDELDNFLRKMEDPNFWRTVKDPQTGQDVVLCNEDVEVLKRLKNSKIPDATHEEYGPWIEWFSSEVMQTPVCDFPESKKSFIPSRHEAKKVSKIVYAIKRGWIKPKKRKPKKKAVYMLWETDNTAEPMRRIHNHISAPKRSLPNHAESYNPPEEYLFDNKERKEWKKLKPSQRKLPFLPCKYSSLRDVPAYEQYVEERFRRCLDLYLCPRTRKMKLLIEPDDLLPKLPSPRDLQPFPTTQSLVYKGHTEMVRTISVEPKGQYLASGSDDFTVKLWEVATGRCVRTIPVGGIVRCVSWCPNDALALLAVAADNNLFLINPCVGDILVVKKTDVLLQEEPEQDVLVSDRLKNAIQWEQATGDDWKKGIRVIIHHFKEIKQVTWHGRGDYFASVMPDAQNRSVIIHQVSKRRSQIPFSRSKGLVQCVLFHPIRPIFFVATQKFVRIYDLVKQIVLKKLFSNAKWISTMAIHPAGDNLLVGTYDRKVLWFDLDLSTKPYQTLRLHSGGVRGVAYHRNYPLFATSSDDNNIIVSHGMVYNDLLQNALIVPLKRLSFHEKINDFSALDIVFHPTQPWLFSTGADSTVRLYT